MWIYIYYNCLSGGLVYVLADVTSSPFSMFIHLTSTALSLVCKTSKGCKQRGQMSLYYVGSSQAEPLCGSLRSLKRNIIWNWPCLYTKCLWHCFKVFNMNNYLRLICAFKRLHCLKSISLKKKIKYLGCTNIFFSKSCMKYNFLHFRSDLSGCWEFTLKVDPPVHCNLLWKETSNVSVSHYCPMFFSL